MDPRVEVRIILVKVQFLRSSNIHAQATIFFLLFQSLRTVHFYPLSLNVSSHPASRIHISYDNKVIMKEDYNSFVPQLCR